MLKVDPRDVYGSWDTFIKQFELEIEIKTMTSGTKKVRDNQNREVEVPNFSDELKCLALIKAVGSDGQHVLESRGYSIRRPTLNYEQTLEMLSQHYGREESLNIRTRNFVTVSQYSGEDNRDYIKRVEQLSRNLDFFNSDNRDIHEALQKARENLALMLAVNGLSNMAVRDELLAKRDLTWKDLKEILMSRCTAQESSAKLGKPEPKVKTEASVSEVQFKESKDKEDTKGDKEDKERESARSSSKNKKQYDSDSDSDRSYKSKRKGRSSKYHDDDSDSRRGSRRRSQSHDGDYRSRKTTRSKDKGKYRRHSSSDRESDRRCRYCDKVGHFIDECPKVRCFKCGRRGHTSRKCGYKSRDSSTDSGSSWRSGRSSSRSRKYRRSPSPYSDRYRDRSASKKSSVRFIDESGIPFDS
jgi:hypothetical protein